MCLGKLHHDRHNCMCKCRDGTMGSVRGAVWELDGGSKLGEEQMMCLQTELRRIHVALVRKLTSMLGHS